VTFYFEPSGVLAELVQPTSGPKRRAYVHRCELATFVEVCHLADELESFTLEELVARSGGKLANSQAALALRFLHERGLLERVHPRRNRRVEKSLFLSAMTEWHALREEPQGSGPSVPIGEA
jgi:hypothetical protein